jgi:hypothetical protein
MPRLVELMKHLSATMEVCTCCTYSSLVSYEKWMDNYEYKSTRLMGYNQLTHPYASVSPSHTILQNNYPDLLYTAKIAPSAWFFSMCYKIVSRAMDDRTRARFETIDAAQLRASLHKIIHPNTLPAHLGGTSSVYTSSIFINNVMNNNATSYSR